MSYVKDKVDQQILSLLVENARLSTSDIARRVNLSRSAVSDRIKQLEQKGVIRGYHANIATLNPVEEPVRAYFELHYHEHNCDDYINRVKLIPEVLNCYTISGQVDMLIYVEAKSISRLDQIRLEIEQFEKITRIRTHMILREGFKR